jgi:antitoxin component YwqK of YwqJK toxin-antitoxin module
MSIDPAFQVKCLKSSDGTIRYIKDNKLHNPEGPALIHPDGKQEYYLNGILYTKDTHKKAKKDGIGLPWYKSGAAKSRH